ncbi:MAG: flavin-containing monooxygenase [Pseudomonadaceae bacterium]
MFDVIVIGAGQAGLAAAHALQQAGLKFHVLEASDRAAGSWPRYYDSLSLFSPARYSGLPGLAFPGNPERYPVRDEVIHYLESYARHFAFPIAFRTRVARVQREAGYFSVITDNGDSWSARTVISASGPFNQPYIPSFPSLEHFTGQILHSADYRKPADIAGSRVAVVGGGNSAIQIAWELASSHEVTISSRHPLRFLAQRPLGRDLHHWLTLSGLDTLPLGRWCGWSPATPVLDPGVYRRALAEGVINQRRLFDQITPNGLLWGKEEQTVDTLLMATGFRPCPDYLEGLDGCSAANAAQQRGGVSNTVPGLFFVGMAWQQSNASATLRGVGHDARRVVKRITRLLEKPVSWRSRLTLLETGCCCR